MTLDPTTKRIEDPIVTTQEVASVLRELNINQAAGPDKLNAAIQKPLANVAAAHLTNLVNLPLTTGENLDCGRVGEVVPIHKRDNNG